jgi:hypothetical protein
MSDLTCRQTYSVARGEVRAVLVDFGENTAGAETGALKAGDTLASATIAVSSKPTGASDPTLSGVTINSGTVYVNGRACSAGEAASFTLTVGASQTYGRYVLLISGTTTNGEIIKRRLLVDVGAE